MTKFRDGEDPKGYLFWFIVLVSVTMLSLTNGYGQMITDMEQSILFKQSLDPSLVEYGKPHFALLGGDRVLSIGVDTNWSGDCNCLRETEKHRFGSYISFKDDDFQTTFYLTKNVGRFAGTLYAGMYDVIDRSATFGGFSLLYHHKGGAFGVKLLDLFDVPLANNSEAAFFQYEQMTPEFVFEQNILRMNETTFKAYGAISYQDINSWGHSWAFEAAHPNGELGYGFNREGESFAYIKPRFNNMAAFVSLGGRGWSVGFTANFK